MSKVLVIDNFDSFTYNIVHAVKSLCDFEVVVQRNDAVDIDVADSSTHLIFSPGPGLPSEAGMMPELFARYIDSHKAILGVCLGHQALGEFMGCKLRQLENVYHGVSSDIVVEKQSPLFEGIDSTFAAGRYHSWVIDESSVNSKLEVLARDTSGTIMAVAATGLPVFGVQFHPESVLTPCGDVIIKNFLNFDPV